MGLWPAFQIPDLYGGEEGQDKAVKEYNEGVAYQIKRFKKLLADKPAKISTVDWFKKNKVRVLKEDPLIIEGAVMSSIAPELDCFPAFIVDVKHRNVSLHQHEV